MLRQGLWEGSDHFLHPWPYEVVASRSMPRRKTTARKLEKELRRGLAFWLKQGFLRTSWLGIITSSLPLIHEQWIPKGRPLFRSPKVRIAWSTAGQRWWWWTAISQHQPLSICLSPNPPPLPCKHLSPRALGMLPGLVWPLLPHRQCMRPSWKRRSWKRDHSPGRPLGLGTHSFTGLERVDSGGAGASPGKAAT